MISFEAIGEEVESRWRAANYSDDVLPNISSDVLREMAPADHLDPWDVIRWLFTTTHIPYQNDVPGTFGQPPITVFNGPRFCVDVYFWMDGTTSIHQHAFCGAFYVLMGSSIHSEYRFDRRELLNARFATGELVLEQVELLEQGDIRPIWPGEQLIHSLFHLDRPSVSICIRTHHSPAGVPQWTYHPPYFARDPFFQSPDLIKKIQSVDLLLNMKHSDTDAMVAQLLDNADFQTTFAILECAAQRLRGNSMDQTFGLDRGEARYQAWLEIAQKRHGQLIERLQPVLNEAHRQADIIGRRSQVMEADHRFFLALLLNVPDRVKILEFVKQRYPQRDPVEQMVEWLEDLTHTQVRGSAEANVLGLPDVDDDYLLVFESLLQGQGLTQVQATFAEQMSPDYALQNQYKIEQSYTSIRESLLFRGLFPTQTQG